MTAPRLARDSAYGRLYQYPHTPVDDKANVDEALTEGLLMPSVTNVIDTESKSFLQQWAAKQAAAAAVEAATAFPDRVIANPDGAIRWAAAAHTRTLTEAAALGDLVHNLCESLSLGDTPDIPDQAAPFIDSWYRFVKDFAPEFVRTECTMYGTVSDINGHPLKYAGTADFIATINGIPLVGDYKTGKGIYDSAGMQLSALANAHNIVDETGENVDSAPYIAGGIVVHLRPDGYKVHPVYTSLEKEGWQAFSALRRAWWSHVRSAASRTPVLVGPKLVGAEHITKTFG